MKKKYFIIAVLVLLAVAVFPFFTPDKSALCPKSYTYSRGICCLDEDGNGLCDKYQKEEPKQPELEMPTAIAPLEQRTYQIIMRDIRFYPSELNITVGDTVEWANKEDVLPHAIYEMNLKFRSSRLKPGEVFSHTFNETGEHVIYSQIYHKVMKNKIIVKEKTIPSLTANLIKEIRQRPNINGLITALFIMFIILINFWILNENKKSSKGKR